VTLVGSNIIILVVGVVLDVTEGLLVVVVVVVVAGAKKASPTVISDTTRNALDNIILLQFFPILLFSNVVRVTE
jgi:hypothetical protein